MQRTRLRLTTVTPAAALPVSLSEVKAQLNLTDDDTADEPLIMGYARAANGIAEKFTGRALITRTYALFLDEWPQSLSGADNLWQGWREGPETLIGSIRREIALPHPPLIGVDHVKTYDDSDTASTYASSNYFVDTASEPGRLVLRKSASAPTTTRAANGIEVQFRAGYGSQMSDVPEAIRHAILAMVGYMNEHRGDCPPDKTLTRSGADALMLPHRIASL